MRDSTMTEYTDQSEFQDENLKAVHLGIEARYFLTQTGIGRRIKSEAESVIDNAKTALLTVKATDAEQIRELQTQALAVSMLLTWLNDMMVAGENAEEQIA
jgi:hypothetical protein